jgi:hypothetical protein
MTPATLGDTRETTATACHWIDGSWRDSLKHHDSINPATGEVTATTPSPAKTRLEKQRRLR